MEIEPAPLRLAERRLNGFSETNCLKRGHQVECGPSCLLVASIGSVLHQKQVRKLAPWRHLLSADRNKSPHPGVPGGNRSKSGSISLSCHWSKSVRILR